jgi:hypothetical protein
MILPLGSPAALLECGYGRGSNGQREMLLLWNVTYRAFTCADDVLPLSSA